MQEAAIQLEGLAEVSGTLRRLAGRLAYVRAFDVTSAGTEVDLGRVEWSPAGALAAFMPREATEPLEEGADADAQLLRAAVAWVEQTARAASVGERRRRFKLMCYGAGGVYLAMCRYSTFAIGDEPSAGAGGPTGTGDGPTLTSSFMADLFRHWQSTLDQTRVHFSAMFSTSVKAQGEEVQRLREENGELRKRLDELTGKVLNARIDAAERVNAADVELAQLANQREVATRFIDRVSEVGALVWGGQNGIDPRLVVLVMKIREHTPELLEVLTDPTLPELLQVPGVGAKLAALLRGMLQAAREEIARNQANAAPSPSTPPPS